jgi:hypothetical protein
MRKFVYLGFSFCHLLPGGDLSRLRVHSGDLKPIYLSYIHQLRRASGLHRMNSLSEITMRKDIQKTDGVAATVAAITGEEPSIMHPNPEPQLCT